MWGVLLVLVGCVGSAEVEAPDVAPVVADEHLRPAGAPPRDVHADLPPEPLEITGPEVPIDLSACGGAAVTYGGAEGIPLVLVNHGTDTRTVRGASEWLDDGTAILHVHGEVDVPGGATKWLYVDVLLRCEAGPGTYPVDVWLTTDGERGPLDQAVPLSIVAT